MVATDGYRLAHARTDRVRLIGTPDPLAGNDPADRSRILAPVIGSRALAVLVRLLDGQKCPSARIVLAWTEDGCLQARSDELSFSSRQLAGRFPAWRDAIPPPSPHRGHLGRSDRLLSILKQARALAAEGRPAVRMELRPGGLAVSVGAPGSGGSRFESPCDYSSEPVRAVLDPIPLIDILEVLDGEAIEIELNGLGAPAVLHAAGLRYIVMARDEDPADDGEPEAGAADDARVPSGGTRNEAVPVDPDRASAAG